MRFLLYIASVLVATASLSARELWVDRTAANPGDGSREHPYLTIMAAATVVNPGDVVMIRPGVYPEWVALERSGTAAAPITFQAAGALGSVIISGADTLETWEPDGNVFFTPWDHDFVIDTKPDGTLVRSHFGDPPLGCAEIVLQDGEPLKMVMSRPALEAGTFYVDWDANRLYVRLLGDRNPRRTRVEGGVRPYLFSPLEQWNKFSEASYITVRGLKMGNAANFPQRGGLVTGDHWLIEDCLVEGNSAGGVNIRGNDVTLRRVTASRNGFAGISGNDCANTLLEDCQTVGNNTRGFNPGNDGGGGKFLRTRNLHIKNLSSHDNTGPGLWLDFDNRDYLVEDSTIAGNRGLTMDWEGSGIATEINPGPGRIINNTIFSNTGAAVGIWECRDLVVEGNTLVDNGIGIGFRAMEGRETQLADVTVTRNRIKDWRRSAVTAGIGNWNANSAAEKHLRLEGNSFDLPEGRPFYEWADLTYPSLESVMAQLHAESGSELAKFSFSPTLIDSRTVTPSGN